MRFRAGLMLLRNFGLSWEIPRMPPLAAQEYKRMPESEPYCLAWRVDRKATIQAPVAAIEEEPPSPKNI